MSKFLDTAGLTYFWQKLKALLNGKVDKVSGKGLSANDYTTAEKAKLAGIAAEANKYVHPAYTAADTGLYKVKVDAQGHVSAASAVAKADITALGIPAQDTKYTHPSHTAAASGLYKVTVDSQGHVSATTPVAKADITALGIPAQDTTYTLPTASASQLGGVKLGANLSIASGVVSVPAMTAATASAAGGAGVVPAPAAGAQAKFLRGDGTWAAPTDTTYAAVTTSKNGLMTSADKKKLDAFGAADTYALKTDMASVYRYKGSVADVSKLPASGNTAGDVYNLEDTGMNCAWTGTAWDDLGAAFTITAVSNADIDSIVAQ